MNTDLRLPIQIRLLGGFEVQRGAQVLGAGGWPRKKAAALLKRLAYEQRLVKDRAIEFLWPEADLETGSNNLYKALHVVRQTLNHALGEDTAQAVFSYTDGILQLSPAVQVDVREFEDLCSNLTGAPPAPRAAQLEQALKIYRGDLLPDDIYEEWTLLPRQMLQRLQREARLGLAAYQLESGDFGQAIATLLPLLELDRADEPVHRELMRAYALSGRRSEAQRQYQACSEALAAELGLPPSAETTDLQAQIMAGELVPQAAARPRQIASPEKMPRPLFVGRKRELQSLRSHLNAALAGAGRVIFITGEAGQGKTSLMNQFADLALADHPELVVAAGACQALIGIADPYLPFREIMAMLTGDWQRPWLGGVISPAHSARLQAIAAQTARAARQSAPDLAGILLPASSPALPGQPAPVRDLSLAQIFHQTWQLLRALARHQPLLLLLDDLQWADAASANLLFYLGRQLAGSSILIVGAIRPSELNLSAPALHPLAPVMQELIRYHGDIQIDLEASTPAEERGFVDALLDSEPNRLDASFREGLYRRTTGQPLFTVELLRALQDRQELVKDDSGMWTAATGLDWSILPSRVEAVITRRMEALPPELRQLLAVASVQGESFSVEVLAQTQPIEGRDLLHVLSGELDQRYRLVREQAEWRLGEQSLTRFQFRHNLIQQACYHSLGAAERKLIHGEVAAALELIGADQLDLLPVHLAQHYLAAGNARRAGRYLCLAGDEARRRLALEEAAHYYQLALQDGQALDLAAQAEVLHKLGEVLLALGQAQAAGERFSEAEQLYAQAGSRAGRGAMWRLIGRAYWEQGARQPALESYHRALALLENEPKSAELARALGAIAQMHVLADEYDQAIIVGERAIALAQEQNTEDVVVHVRVSLGIARAVTGEAAAGLAMLAQSQAQAEELGLPHDTGRAYAGWGDTLISLERYDEARRVYEQMLSYTRQMQTSMFEGVALVQLGYLDWWSGRWRAAWERGLEIQAWMNAAGGTSMAKVWASNFLGCMYNDLGLPQQAHALLAPYTSTARSAAEAQTTIPHLAQCMRCAQSAEDIAALAREILDLVDGVAYPRYEILPALLHASCWLAEASAGDASVTGRLEKTRPLMPGHLTAACLDEARACTARQRGKWGQAAGLYAAAAAHREALGQIPDTMRNLALQAQALSFASQPAGAQDVRARAAAIFDQLASQLDDPAVKQAFLVSPLAQIIRPGPRDQAG